MPGAGLSMAGSGTESRTANTAIRLNNADDLFKPAMTGTAKIYCGEHRLFDLVTRRSCVTSAWNSGPGGNARFKFVSHSKTDRHFTNGPRKNRGRSDAGRR